MAKKQKGPMKKHVRLAAQARKQRQYQLYKLLVAVLGGILLWAIISFTPINTHTQVASFLIFVVVVVAVFFIGLVGNKYSRYSTEYNRLKREYGVTDEMVKDLMKHEHISA